MYRFRQPDSDLAVRRSWQRTLLPPLTVEATQRKGAGYGTRATRLCRRPEVQHHGRSDRGHEESDIEQWIRRRLGWMYRHCVQDIHERRAAEHERHDIGGQPAGAERKDDA